MEHNNNSKQEEMFNIASVDLPPEFSSSIKNTIKKDLKITKLKIIFLIICMHCISALLVLSICPQMGVSIFKFEGLYWLFMQAGHHVCQFMCGFLFISSSICLNQLFLPKAFLNYLRYIKYHQILLLTFGSIVFFFFFGNASINIFSFLWIIGAVVGGGLFARLPMYIYRSNPLRIPV